MTNQWFDSGIMVNRNEEPLRLIDTSHVNGGCRRETDDELKRSSYNTFRHNQGPDSRGVRFARMGTFDIDDVLG